MIEIEVQPHADRVGGYNVIDLARLEHRDLFVAGLGRERAHHHRRAAAEAPQRLGHGVNLLDAEGDHGRAFGQAREFADARVGQRGETRTAGDLRLGDQRLDHRFQRGGAEDHRLFPASSVQQSVSEDMPAFRVCAQLCLVQRHEGVLAAGARHGFGRAEEIAGVWRFDPLLAGDQRDLLVTLDRAHPVIDLAREQAQREAHHAGGMAAHPLDRQVRLAGVGRPQHRAHTHVIGVFTQRAEAGELAGRRGSWHGISGSVRLAPWGQGRQSTGVAHKGNVWPCWRCNWPLVNRAFTMIGQRNATWHARPSDGTSLRVQPSGHKCWIMRVN